MCSCHRRIVVVDAGGVNDVKMKHTRYSWSYRYRRLSPEKIIESESSSSPPSTTTYTIYGPRTNNSILTLLEPFNSIALIRPLQAHINHNAQVKACPCSAPLQDRKERQRASEQDLRGRAKSSRRVPILFRIRSRKHAQQLPKRRPNAF